MKLLLLFFLLPLVIFAQLPAQPEKLDIKELSIEELSTKVDDLSAGGKLEDAVTCLLLLQEKIDKKYGVATQKSILPYSNLAVAYESLGDFEQAEVYYQKTLNLIISVLGEESPNYILNLAYYGDFLKVTGRTVEAKKHLLRSYALAKKNKSEFKNVAEYIAPMGFLANFYRDNKQYEKALPLYLEQKEIYETEVGEQDPEYGANLSNLASLYTAIGQYQKALELNKKAVAVTEKYSGTASFAYGQRINNLASDYSQISEFIIVDSLYFISLQNAKKIFGKEHREYAIRLQNLGVNNIRMGNYLLAKEQIEDTRRILLENYPKYHPRILIATFNYASILAKIGEGKKASKLLIDALSFDKKNESASLYPNTIGVFKDVGWIFELQNDVSLVEQYYMAFIETELAVLQHKFDHYNERDQLKYAKALQSYFDRFESYSYRHPNQKNFIEQCLNNKLIKKGLLLENNNRLTAAIQSEGNVKTKSDYAEWQKLKANLAKEYGLSPARRAENFTAQVDKVEALEGKLARASVSFKKAHQFTTVKEIAAQLKKGEVAIEFSSFTFYAEGKQEKTDSILYVAYLIKKEWETPKMIPLFEEKDLPNLKHTKKIYQFSVNKAANLFHLIWAKLAPEMEGMQTIYYSPVGLLHRINFSAIPINASETVADRFQVYTLGSTRQLVFPHEDSNDERIDAVLFGGIDYEKDTIAILGEKNTDTQVENEALVARSLGDKFRSYRGKSWYYLKWTKKEVEKIAVILQAANVEVSLKKGQSAKEAFFKIIGKDKPSPRILHLATHGYFFSSTKKSKKIGFQSSEHPLIRSGLVLAGGNHVWKGGAVAADEEDGILTAYEIAQMDLSNTELVVLSACETGLGDIEGSEGVYGLQRAFKMAGVKYVLMSLWSVKDKQTYQFMARFYELYQSAQKTIPEAYQMAQNEMRKQYAKPFNPRLWAGFVLME